MKNNEKEKYFCFHGHFYQPPRECPWFNTIEKQPSAAPFDNWNARINNECYEANGRAPIINSDGTVLDVVNNYAWMSFNMGPTLLSWMEKHAQETYKYVLEGDQASQKRLGHGNAIAQVYNHMIMPLAHGQDQKTQVIWGKEDFRFRFGREPEGMHLAETAVNTATLEALAAEDIKFTILAPRQAKRWRKIDSSEWHEGSIDPSRSYICKLPSGKSIVIFFYDGPISQAVAFERLLSSGEVFLNRIHTGFSSSRDHNQLLHLAVDGETAGHHHRHGEMCLSWLFKQLSVDTEVSIINYGAFLELNPPEWEVEIVENSSWSCSHGIERWRSDCGCKTNHEWHQRWRAPLRDGMNGLRSKLDTIFSQEGTKYFSDPWSARNAYISVLLDSSKRCLFVAQHCHRNLNKQEIVQAFNLLEMERNGMLMFTSCAWFFDDISGIEPIQNLRYAARAIELASEFTDEDLESALLAFLTAATSNLPQIGNGETVWKHSVKPGAIAKKTQLLIAAFKSTLSDLARLGEQLADTLGIHLE
jgi:alpha-amylase/alpha-mannosidase (GH57 family)